MEETKCAKPSPSLEVFTVYMMSGTSIKCQTQQQNAGGTQGTEKLVRGGGQGGGILCRGSTSAGIQETMRVRMLWLAFLPKPLQTP